MLIPLIILIVVFLIYLYFQRAYRLKILISPYPDGKEFALTIIDDTDGATLEKIDPI